MPDLHDLDVLLTGWQQYLASHETGSEHSRAAGFHAALDICVKQLAETLERVRADADEQYATLQAEHLAAADIDHDAREMSD